MKIILDNELEKQVWEIMMSAHYKWEKNYGDTLRSQMEWSFNTVFGDQIKAMIEQEVENRLKDSWGEQLYNDLVNLSEDEYVAKGLQINKSNGLSEDELNKLPDELREEYKSFREELEEDREYQLTEVDFEIKNMYSRFFNSPENLTVIYKGTVIQGDKEESSSHKDTENGETEFLKNVELQVQLNRLRHGEGRRPINEWAMIVSAHTGHLMDSIMKLDKAEVEKELFHVAAPLLELYKDLDNGISEKESA